MEDTPQGRSISIPELGIDGMYPLNFDIWDRNDWLRARELHFPNSEGWIIGEANTHFVRDGDSDIHRWLFVADGSQQIASMGERLVGLL